MPEEPPPTDVEFPSPVTADEHGRVLVGGDLQPGTILSAYRHGLFPMRLSNGDLVWWSPDPRGVLDPAAPRIPRSLRQAVRRFEITADTAFDDVVRACAARPDGEYVWITDEVRAAYGELHRLGWAHSVEAWVTEDGERCLVGGLYGLAVGGLFAGESMFHHRRDASKAAFVALVGMLATAGDVERRIVDVQWLTPHLASLGATEIARTEYQQRLETALQLSPPAFEVQHDP